MESQSLTSGSMGSATWRNPIGGGRNYDPGGVTLSPGDGGIGGSVVKGHTGGSPGLLVFY